MQFPSLISLWSRVTATGPPLAGLQQLQNKSTACRLTKNRVKELFYIKSNGTFLFAKNKLTKPYRLCSPHCGYFFKVRHSHSQINPLTATKSIAFHSSQTAEDEFNRILSLIIRQNVDKFKSTTFLADSRAVSLNPISDNPACGM